MNLRKSWSNIQGSARWNWQRLGESAALGSRVAWAYLPLGLLGPVLLEPNRVGGSVGSWIVVGLFGQATVFVSLWIARLVIHRRNASQPRPIANLVAIVIAIGLRGVAIGWMALQLSLTDNLELTYRIEAGLLTQTGLLVAVAVIVSSFSFHRQLAARLWNQQEKLRELNLSMQDRLGGTRGALAAQVRQTIDPLIEEINRGLDQVAEGQSSEAIRDSIRDIVDEQLRPLSRSLDLQGGLEIELPESTSTPLTTWIPLPSKPPMSLLIRPFSTSFLAALLAASQGLISSGLAGAILYPLVGFILTVLILTGVRALIGTWKIRLWWGISLTFLLTACAVGVAKFLAIALQLSFPTTSNFITLIGGGFAGTVAATFALANKRRTSTERDLQDSIDELRLKLSVLRQHEFVTRKELSYILHGSVQSALHVAAIKLASQAEPDSTLLETIRRDITLATSRLEAPSSSDALLIDTLADIAELWHGTCSVKWTLDYRTIRRLAESPITANCVAEITRECVGNAIHHGHATQVWLTITENTEWVTLTSLDNGNAITDWKPGMGSQMMNEMCISWSHSTESQGTLVKAEIAIAPK